MSERSKYAINGVYKCENFEQLLAQGNFPNHPLGTAGNIINWYIKWNNGVFDSAYLMISCSDKPTLKLRYLINIRKKNGRLCFKKQQSLVAKNGDGLKGCSVSTRLLLHEDIGSLVNGAITVEYGLQVEAILGRDGIWKFNIFDKFFECKDKQNMVTCRYQNCITGRKKKFYCHKQLITFHSSNYIGTVHKIWVNHGSAYLLGRSIQIAHGVRAQIKGDEYIKIMVIAQDLNLLNVIQYCEQHFLRLHNNSLNTLLRDAIRLNLRHILAHSLKEIESLEYLVSEVKEMDIEELPGESMKMIAAKIFKRKY